MIGFTTRAFVLSCFMSIANSINVIENIRNTPKQFINEIIKYIKNIQLGNLIIFLTVIPSAVTSGNILPASIMYALSQAIFLIALFLLFSTVGEIARQTICLEETSQIYAIINSQTMLCTGALVAICVLITQFVSYANSSMPSYFFMFLMLPIMAGAMYTKAGDIVTDFKQKILKQGEEDKTDSQESIADNIGDIVGDAFIVVIVSIFSFALHISTITFFINLEQALLFITNKIFLSGIISMILFRTFTKLNRHVSEIFVASYALLHFTTIAYDITPISLGAILNAIKYNAAFFAILGAVILIPRMLKFVRQVLIFGLNQITIIKTVETIALGGIIAFIINSASLVITNAPRVIALISTTYSIEIHLILITVIIYKTVVGAATDSANGMIKKMFMTEMESKKKASQENKEEGAEEENTDKHLEQENLAKRSKLIEDELDNIDDHGNMYKLESKIYFFLLTNNIILKKIAFGNLFCSSMSEIFIILFICMYVFAHVCRKIYADKNTDMVRAVTISSGALVLVITSMIHTFYYKLMLKTAYFLGTCSLLGFFSLWFCLSGSFFDISKKSIELLKQSKETGEYEGDDIEIVKDETIRQDIGLGDVLKDYCWPCLVSMQMLIMATIAS